MVSWCQCRSSFSVFFPFGYSHTVGLYTTLVPIEISHTPIYLIYNYWMNGLGI